MTGYVKRVKNACHVGFFFGAYIQHLAFLQLSAHLVYEFIFRSNERSMSNRPEADTSCE